MSWQRLWKNCAHRQYDEGSDQHQLIGDWVEDGSELRLLVKTPGQQAVKTVSYARQNEDGESQNELLVEEKRDEDRDQDHPEDRKQVRDGNDPR